MISNHFNTGMGQNSPFYFSSPQGPNKLTPSPGSAFQMQRKRTRDSFGSEAFVSNKRFKESEAPTCEEFNSIVIPPEEYKIETHKNEESEPSREDTNLTNEDSKDLGKSMLTKLHTFESYESLNVETRQEMYLRPLTDIGNQ